MKYVYILQSLESSEHFHVGITDDLKSRLARHNAGDVPHTANPDISPFGAWGGAVGW